MSETYFFDTYALVEIIKGSENYKSYKDAKIVTTLLNLMELHYSTMKDLGDEKALMFFNELKQFTISFDEKDVLNANYFKHKENSKGKKISYIDALGYVLAIMNNIKFFTGDKEFEDIENVEYVKG
ncbi:PIN domain-containing protein [Candidatus Woesearchaeota archaeon]|nr:PIN domain-containing protein [Candidatus Woesearchaeota archaeon]